MGYEALIEAPSTAPAAAAPRPGPNGALKLLLAIAALTAAAGAIRFYGLGSRALWLDEAYSSWFSALPWAELWIKTPQYETHPPTYYTILKLWRAVAGDDAAALRSLSALAGLLAVPVAALAARELGALTRAPRTFILALIACAMVALSPRLVIVGQDARPYALLLLSYAAALAFWLRLTRAFKGAERPEGSVADWAGLGVSTILVLWLHGLGLLYAAALLGALILTAAPAARRARWIRLSVTVALAGLAYLPCLLMMAARTGDWSNGWLQWDPTALPGAMLDLFGLHRLDEAVTPIVARVLMAVLLFIGLRAVWRSGERTVAWGLTTLILFPPLAAALISQVGFPVFLPRTLVAVIAPAYLVAAFGIAQLPARRLVLAAGAVALIFAINLAQTATRPSLEKWDLAAGILKREMKPGDVIWAYPNDVQLPLELALGRSERIVPIPAPYPAVSAPGYRRLGSPAVVTLDGPLARDWAVKHKPSPHATIWLVWIDSALADPDGQVIEQLAAGRSKGRRREWDALTLLPLHPAS